MTTMIQDWITQQWVILFGQKINSTEHSWLMGPFGGTKGIGSKFIKQLATNENLIVDYDRNNKGLIQSIEQLNLSKNELNRLNQEVVDFYENTSNYNLQLAVKWNPFFKGFGILLRIIFSRRIEQLNVPIKSTGDVNILTSEIIQLLDNKTNEVKRTIWYREFKATGQVVYSGIYETCTIPSVKTCIKAVFPLPNGNATVILTPKIGKNGELILESSGNQLGDSGFYFLLQDNKNQLWTKFIRSFRDTLVVRCENEKITATQTLTLWNLSVLQFEYNIKKREPAKS